MSKELFSNNAQTTLAGAITNVALTANLSPGSGVLFPAPGAGQYFTMTFVDAATGLVNEIVWVTDVTGDVITMLRAQEGTTAKAWLAGDIAANFLTAASAAKMAQDVQVQSNSYNYAADTGAANAYLVALSPAVGSVGVEGPILYFKAAHTNNAASNITFNGGTTYPLVGMALSALAGGEIFADGYCAVTYNTALASYVLLECAGGAQQLPNGSYGTTQAAGDSSTKLATTAFAQTTGGEADNLFANGSFRVWNTANGQVNFASPAGVYSADQVVSNLGTGGAPVLTVTRQTWALGDANNVNGNQYYFQAAQTAAATATAPTPLKAIVEGVRASANKTLYVRVRAWCAAGTVIVTPTAKQVFGTGGSPSATVNTAANGGTILLTTVPQEFTMSFTLPSIAGKTIGTNTDDSLQLEFATPVNATYTTSWDSLKISLKNRPFVPGLPGDDEQRCSRYYQIIGGYSVNDFKLYDNAAIGASILTMVNYTQKRTKPTNTRVGTWSLTNCSAQPDFIAGQASLTTAAISTPATAAGLAVASTVDTTTYLEINARI